MGIARVGLNRKLSWDFCLDFIVFGTIENGVIKISLFINEDVIDGYRSG